MKKYKALYRLIVCGLIAAAAFSGCSSAETDTSGTQSTAQSSSAASFAENSSNNDTSSSVSDNTSEDTESTTKIPGTGLETAAEAVNVENIEFKAKDNYTDYTSGCVNIALSDSGMTSGTGYTADGSRITITAEGTYVLSGTLSDGQIVVNAPKEADVRLVLNNVSITCTSSAAIYVSQADKVIISLPENTTNTLTDKNPSQDAEGNDITAAVYSKESLTINGSGILNVNANNNDAITSKDTLKITGGTLNINSVDDGLTGKDRVLIRDGIINIECNGDGIKSTNTESDSGYFYMEGGTLTIKAGNDGVQAETSMLITGGTIDITTGGGSANATSKTDNNGFGGGRFFPTNPDSTDSSADSESMKGLKASYYIDITGGTITFDTEDDSIHSGDTVRIAGGTITATSGDDGVHADSVLEISGGKIDITKSYEGLEAQKITISGGDTSVVSSDDGINAAGGTDSLTGRPTQDSFNSANSAVIEITGGQVIVNASGDGIDSNGTLTISGGTVIVSGPTDSGNGAFDTDGTFIINGGNILGIGSSGMMSVPSSGSAQNSISVALGTSYNANSKITVKDADGNTLAEYTSPKSFNAIQYSSSHIELNKDYSFYVDDTLVTTVTATSTVITSGSSGMGGGMKGNRF